MALQCYTDSRHMLCSRKACWYCRSTCVNKCGGSNSADLGGSSDNSDERFEDRRGEGFFCTGDLQKVSRDLRAQWNATERQWVWYYSTTCKCGDAFCSACEQIRILESSSPTRKLNCGSLRCEADNVNKAVFIRLYDYDHPWKYTN